MSSAEKVTQIIAFDQDTTYLMWSNKFLARGLICGYDDLLLGDVKIEKSMNDDEKNKITEKNGKAYADLMLSCMEDAAFNIV